MKENTRTVIIMVCLAIVAICNLIVSQSDLNITFSMDKSCVAADFKCFFYSWQTLIAGGMALAGAGFTVFLIQRQIRLTRWEHGREEISQLITERERFVREFTFHGTRFGSEDAFANNGKMHAEKTTIINNAVSTSKAKMQELCGDNFDVLIANKFIREARGALIREIEICLHELERGSELATEVEFPKSAPVSPIEGRYRSIHDIFAERVFATEAPAIWRAAITRANKACSAYVDAINTRIDRIRTLYGQD